MFLFFWGSYTILNSQITKKHLISRLCPFLKKPLRSSQKRPNEEGAVGHRRRPAAWAARPRRQWPWAARPCWWARQGRPGAVWDCFGPSGLEDFGRVCAFGFIGFSFGDFWGAVWEGVDACVGLGGLGVSVAASCCSHCLKWVWVCRARAWDKIESTCWNLVFAWCSSSTVFRFLCCFELWSFPFP